MPIHLNAEMLAHAYEYLSCQRPFNVWNLPPSEDVKFMVIRTPDRYAHYQMVGGVHHIAVSTKFVGRHEVLIATIAHEMIHLHIRSARIPMRTPHGKAFQKLADDVCKAHDFDRLTF